MPAEDSTPSLYKVHHARLTAEGYHPGARDERTQFYHPDGRLARLRGSEQWGFFIVERANPAPAFEPDADGIQIDPALVERLAAEQRIDPSIPEADERDGRLFFSACSTVGATLNESTGALLVDAIERLDYSTAALIWRAVRAAQ